VADAFDAMTFDRPYSSAISFEAARREIRRSTGTHFDPAVVETFLGIPLEVLAAIRRASVDPDLASVETETAVLAIPGVGLVAPNSLDRLSW
jgi:HD-GYP domain-containing protein (c-di-GMP phosphodiesterase class II)